MPQLVNISSAASSIPCVDTLAAAKYPQAITSVPLNFAIGGFAKTFGDFFPVAKSELDRGRLYIRVNLMWADDHKFSDRDIPFLRSEAKRYQILCRHFKTAKIELVPFTEHSLTNPDKYLAIVQAAAPNCTVVNSIGTGRLSSKYKNEVHGAAAKPRGRYNYSYDGTNSADSDILTMRAKHSTADIFCVWHPRLNLRWHMKDSTPRSQRDAKPTRELINSLVYLFTEKGRTTIPSGWIVKSHAEKHTEGDQKGDKLMIISPVRGSAIVLKRGSRVVATLPFYGSYEGGGWRYYAPEYGYTYGSNLDVYVGSKKYGTINGGFRDGSYR